MATNPPVGDGHRNGAVRDRSQFMTPAGNSMPTDVDTSPMVIFDPYRQGMPGAYRFG